MVARGVRAGLPTTIDGGPAHHLHHQDVPSPIKVQSNSNNTSARNSPIGNGGRPTTSALRGRQTPPAIVTNRHSPVQGTGNNNNSPQVSSSTNHHRFGAASPRHPVGSPLRTRYNSSSNPVTRDPPPTSAQDYLLEDVISGEPVCDYDTNATVLYELLESSNWEGARSRCRSHPEEVRTWIVRKDRSLQVRWKLLPLHAAIIFQCPNYVVSALLERYPAAASRQDDQGMLPLHLAFRHKQEDEDLLELLLLQYPKAVMMKDRRDRVPLEHGRDCKYSARLMRIYADATVAGARVLQQYSGVNIKTVDSNQKTEQTSPTMASMGETERARLEAEHEGKMAMLRAEHEDYIQRLKKEHDGFVKEMREQHNAALRQVKNVAQDERQTLIDQHNDEMNELREILARQVGKDKQMTDALENEVAHLQMNLQETSAAHQRLLDEHNELHGVTLELHTMLQRIVDDQSKLQEVVSQQQDDLEAARAIRNELLQSFVKQEEMDGANLRVQSSKLIEMSEKTKKRVEDIMAKTSFKKESGLSKEGPSRIEMERRDLDELYTENNDKTDNQNYYGATVVVPEATQKNGNIITNTNNIRNEVITEEQTYGEIPRANAQEEENYADVRILGDDISAITDNSEF